MTINLYFLYVAPQILIHVDFISCSYGVLIILGCFDIFRNRWYIRNCWRVSCM